MIDLNTPIGCRLTTDPDVMGYNGPKAQVNAMAFFQMSTPWIIGVWDTILGLEVQGWREFGWYKGAYGRGVAVYRERCVRVDGVWRKLTQYETDHLMVLSAKKRLSRSKK